MDIILELTVLPDNCLRIKCDNLFDKRSIIQDLLDLSLELYEGEMEASRIDR